MSRFFISFNGTCFDSFGCLEDPETFVNAVLAALSHLNHLHRLHRFAKPALKWYTWTKCRMWSQKLFRVQFVEESIVGHDLL